jgi:predicted MFS family arabinose efflux permease
LSAVRPASLPALLAETFSVQALGTMAVLAIPALAPAVALTLGVSTAQVGYQVGVIYVAAMLGSLSASACVGTFGPSRTGQIAMLLDAAGCVVASIATIPAVVVGSLLIGCAYGLINPAASELLNRYSPPNRRNLIFSIKQTGVPAGGMAAGLVGPTLALAAGWQAVLWAVAVACVLVAAAAQPGRAVIDAHRGGPGKLTGFSLDALRGVFASPQLRWLALSSFCFSAVQLCVVAFLVALLVEDIGFDLVLAGAMLAVVQVAGAGGRVLWGFVADLLRDGLSVLLGLAVVMAVAALVVVLAPALPLGLTLAAFVVLGITAVGWNGVYLSEVARLSPAQGVSATTGAAMFVTFTGVVFGPALFSALHGPLRSYTAAYALLVAVSLAATVMIAAVRFRRSA